MRGNKEGKNERAPSTTSTQVSWSARTILSQKRGKEEKGEGNGAIGDFIMETL